MKRSLMGLLAALVSMPLMATAQHLGAGNIGSATLSVTTATCRGELAGDLDLADHGFIAISIENNAVTVSADTKKTIVNYNKTLPVVGGKKGSLDAQNRIVDANVYAESGTDLLSVLDLGYSSADNNMGAIVVLTLEGKRYYSTAVCDRVN